MLGLEWNLMWDELVGVPALAGIGAQEFRDLISAKAGTPAEATLFIPGRRRAALQIL